MPRDSSIPLTVVAKQELATEGQLNNSPVEVIKEPSFLEKMGSFFSNKEQKEGTKEKLEKQKQELAQVVENYKKERSDVVWSSKQDKTSLLKEVWETIQELKNLSGGSLGDNKEKAEQAYENLEAKITNTKESVSFESDFIKQAIDNLEWFKKALEWATFNSTTAELPNNSEENTKALEAAGFKVNDKVRFTAVDGIEYTGTIKSGSKEKEWGVIISFGDNQEYTTLIKNISKVTTVSNKTDAKWNNTDKSAQKAKTFLDGVKFADKKNKNWPKAEFEQAKNEIANLSSDTDFIHQLSTLTEYEDSTNFNTVKDVLLIQLALTKLGYKPGTVDGVYRNDKDWDKKKYSETMRAVKAFQTVNTDVDGKKLVIDGIVGPKTLAKMVEALKAKSTTAPTPPVKPAKQEADEVDPAPIPAPVAPVIQDKSTLEKLEEKIKANQEVIARQFTFEGTTPEVSTIDASATYPEMKFRNWLEKKWESVTLGKMKVDMLSGKIIDARVLVNGKLLETELDKNYGAIKLNWVSVSELDLDKAFSRLEGYSTTESRANLEKEKMEKQTRDTSINKALTEDKILDSKTSENGVYKNIIIDNKTYNIMKTEGWPLGKETTEMNLRNSLGKNPIEQANPFVSGEYTLLEVTE